MCRVGHCEVREFVLGGPRMDAADALAIAERINKSFHDVIAIDEEHWNRGKKAEDAFGDRENCYWDNRYMRGHKQQGSRYRTANIAR